MFDIAVVFQCCRFCIYIYIYITYNFVSPKIPILYFICPISMPEILFYVCKEPSYYLFFLTRGLDSFYCLDVICLQLPRKCNWLKFKIAVKSIFHGGLIHHTHFLNWVYPIKSAFTRRQQLSTETTYDWSISWYEYNYWETWETE